MIRRPPRSPPFPYATLSRSISPAGSIRKTHPAGQYLIAHGVEPKDFNSYGARRGNRSEEHTSELQSLAYIVCRLLLEKKNRNIIQRLYSATSPRDSVQNHKP